MTEEKLRQEIHDALDRRLAGMREDPWLAQRVIEASKGEKPVKKKISASVLLALALILLVSAALAAGLGLFGEIADSNDFQTDKERLSGLDSVSQVISASVTTDDGITVDINQCYYEDNRVFISYRVSGNTYTCERHEGAPEGDIKWDWIEKDFIYAENMMSVIPAQHQDILWLDGQGQRWEEIFDASLHDGLLLTDGTYLDIIGGDIVVQDDGSIIGWKECEVPADKQTATLEIKAVLFRTNSIHFQDGGDFYSATTRGESTDIPFTAVRNDQLHHLSGAFATDVYQASADFTVGQIDMRGTIRLTCPEEWYRAHDDWDYESEEDLIEAYALYQGDTLLSDVGTESESYEAGNVIIFDQLYACPSTLDGLRLVPIYTRTGPHPNEAIPLAVPMNAFHGILRDNW